MIEAIVEVNVIPEIYLHHLSDPEMKQIYYFWDGIYYRLQTRFVRGSCIALISGKGCMLGDYRPLICRVWPFWWKSGANLSAKDFPIEINGDCTMATHWNMSIEEILKEFGYSRDAIRKDLLTLNKALKEHSEIMKEANEKEIPPKKLIGWILSNILGL